MKWPWSKSKINIVSREELESIPEGAPMPSIVPTKGYGNHSCGDCLNYTCPLQPYLGKQKEPNRCSFYWPPNLPNWEPGEWYNRELSKIAKEIASNR